MKAREQPEQNHLGLDIREKLTDRANAWAKEVGCERNVHFMMSNATVSLSNILSTYPGKVRNRERRRRNSGRGADRQCPPEKGGDASRRVVFGWTRSRHIC